MKHYMLDPETHAITWTHDLMEWARWFEEGNRRVDETTLTIGDVRISTVFLGIDHSFSMLGDAEPILFETMIFGGPLDEYQVRYATWEQAKAGHLVAVRKAKRAQLPWNYLGYMVWNAIPYSFKWAVERRWQQFVVWAKNFF